MNCPLCSSPENRIIRTETTAKTDRRRHQCPTGHRWWSTARIDRQSTSQLDLGITLLVTGQHNDANSAKQNNANSAPLGFSSDLDLASEAPDLSEDHIANYPARAQARTPPRSIKGAKFTALLEIFGGRWARSYKRPYPVSAADKNQLGRFLHQHPGYIDSFAAICDRYLSDRGQFLISRSGGHSLRWLVTNGLALYGGQPRESAEAHAARIRMEHEERKRRNRSLAPQAPEMRELIAGLAAGKAAGY